MALSGELMRYIGNEFVPMATKTAGSALSSVLPSAVAKAGTDMAAKSTLGIVMPNINRLLDKTGKPITLYHSTPNKFTEFSDEMLGSNTGYDNTSLGHFVTPDKDFSKRFIDINNKGLKGQTMELQANIHNPILHPYMAGSKYKDPALRDKIVENYFLATDNQEGLNTLRDMVAEDAAEFGKDANLYNEYMALADDPGGEGPFFSAGDERELLKKKGYDAVELIEGPKSGLVEGAKSDAPVSSYAVFSGDSLRPVRHIPVEGSSSLSSIIPVKRKLYRGQQYSNTDFSYNSELMNENPDKWGSKDVGKGYHFTPKKGMAGSWEGSDGGVIEVDYTPDQVLKADDARKMIKEANELLADDKYMAKLWQENEALAEQIEKIADGNLEALAKREGKPFVQHLKANDDELGTMYYYKDIDPELTDRFVSEFKQKAEKYMPKRASANGDDMVTLFHNTKAENIPSIMEQGLIPGKRPGGYLVSPEEAGIWTDDRGLKSGSYGGTTVKIRVPKKEFDATRVNDTQNLLNRVIKPSEIEGVDYMLFDTPLIKNSNLQEYIDKYGEDKVRNLIEKKGLVSPEVIEEAFSGLGGSAPKVQQSLVSPDERMSYGYGGGYGSYDDNVKRIGSSEVAPVREETLPDGWKELEKYLDTSKDRLSLAIGKPRSKITKQDLINFLEDYGYDTEGTKDDLWKNALMCIDDMAVDDLYNAGGSAGEFLQERLPFRHNDKITDATNYYIGAKGRTGRLDAEYSDRLGIGRSNTPMSDRLINPYSGAGGDYAKGAFGTDATWASGESGVSTSAHERMHAWQDINKFDWDEEVGDAIDELRGELKKFYHDEDTIKKYWGNSKTDYYAEDVEQEARMLQSYLDNEGYTNTYRKNSEKGTEWGDEIKPAFDRFFKKLRALSKKGIALPAIAGLVGVGALAGKKDDKSVDNIK